nr:hypothetical protein [Rhabdothermincola sediminis]
MALRERERPQRSPRRIEALGSVPQPEEDLLHRLVRERDRAQEAASEGMGRRCVTPVGLGERSVVTPADRAHQRGVVQIVEIGTVHGRHTGFGGRAGWHPRRQLI